MIIRRKNFHGKVNEMDLPVTEEQIADWLGGTLIQRAMPHLTPTQREFLITGMSEEEQNNFFGQFKEEDDEETGSTGEDIRNV